MAIKKPEADGLHIEAIKRGRLTLRLIGETPFYFHAMSLKAKTTLLLGGAKKTAAEKRDLKHDPETEFRDSVYRVSSGPTLLGFPAPGIKGAMATAALETGGLTKAAVNRRIFLYEEKIAIWGTPLLKMDVVRSADMAKTPDIRTRAYLPTWGARVKIAFNMDSLSPYSIVSLLNNAGAMVGIGDYRQEKGRGSYGTFRVIGEQADADDEAIWAEIEAQGRDVQQAALDDPQVADDDTRELMAILDEERSRRGVRLVA